ncbi:MAG: precorrin-4 C(11)-methyltransferase [Chloroflexaceae bacterium]|nr:precorrin-4 C(11)-methyltransferase [Chloroflexaceae bacterium]
MNAIASAGTVYFIGAGPGAADLITVRGAQLIAVADVILYADSLVQEAITQLSRKSAARVIGSSGLHLTQIVEVMVLAAQAGQTVARVHTGDPSLYGAIQEQIAGLEQHGIPWEIVPGVTAAFAAAARLGVELTQPELAQTVILSRMAGRTPVPTGEELRSLATHGTTLVLYLSVAQIEQMVNELLAGGAYTGETPVAVVYRVTWPDEQWVTGTLSTIAAQVRAAGYTRHTLILVGPALDAALHRQRSAAVSRLYDASFAHGYRSTSTSAVPTPPPQSHPRIAQTVQPSAHTTAVIAVTRQGSLLAARLAEALSAVLIVPARFVHRTIEGLQTQIAWHSYEGSVLDEIHQYWLQQRRLVLIMATGIAVRAIAPLVTQKQYDPAVVCLDEQGHSIIPLLGGHQAGANDLARQIAGITRGYAAITTASDVQQKPALDRPPPRWSIAAGSELTHASACLVNDDCIGVFIDPSLPPTMQQQSAAWLGSAEHLVHVTQVHDLARSYYVAGLVISHQATSLVAGLPRHKLVIYHPPVLVVGMGCRRQASYESLHTALHTTLTDAGLALESVAMLATVDFKVSEPGLQTLARVLNLPLIGIAQTQLEALDANQFSPSAAQDQLGLPGVAEPCAVLAAAGHNATAVTVAEGVARCAPTSALLVPKRRFPTSTVAIAMQQHF